MSNGSVYNTCYNICNNIQDRGIRYVNKDRLIQVLKTLNPRVVTLVVYTFVDNGLYVSLYGNLDRKCRFVTYAIQELDNKSEKEIEEVLTQVREKIPVILNTDK
jgi:hypothetical protein